MENFVMANANESRDTNDAVPQDPVSRHSVRGDELRDLIIIDSSDASEGVPISPKKINMDDKSRLKDRIRCPPPSGTTTKQSTTRPGNFGTRVPGEENKSVQVPPGATFEDPRPSKFHIFPRQYRYDEVGYTFSWDDNVPSNRSRKDHYWRIHQYADRDKSHSYVSASKAGPHDCEFLPLWCPNMPCHPIHSREE